MESSPFKLFAIDAVARNLDARVMLPEEVQMLLMLDRILEATSTYKDLGLAMDFSGRDHELAVHLYNQLPQEQRDFDKFPAVFTGLMPVKSDTGKYGLAFEVMSYTEMRTAKILASLKGNFNDNDPELLRTGLPSGLGEGSRRLYPRDQKQPSLDNLGIWAFCLDTRLGLGSDRSDLDISYCDGRVVVVSGEATRENFRQELARKTRSTI